MPAVTSTDSQQFLRELDKKLWIAADRLRANLDAAVYSRVERDSLLKAARRVDAEASSNHAVLGLNLSEYWDAKIGGDIRRALIEADLIKEQEDDDEPFAERMTRLVPELNAQFAESAKLEARIKRNLEGLGYGK